MREFIVWNENGDPISGPHRSRDVAERNAQKEREWCARNGCGNGNPESSEDQEYGTTCGVMDPHGISIQVTENGRDVTGHVY